MTKLGKCVFGIALMYVTSVVVTLKAIKRYGFSYRDVLRVCDKGPRDKEEARAIQRAWEKALTSSCFGNLKERFYAQLAYPLLVKMSQADRNMLWLDG